MADRVSVAIRIGGSLSPALLPDFCAAIESDGACIDWEGTPFDPEIFRPIIRSIWLPWRSPGAGSKQSRRFASIMASSSRVGPAPRLDRSVPNASSTMVVFHAASPRRTMMRS
jgi:hypothetical protein